MCRPAAERPHQAGFELDLGAPAELGLREVAGQRHALDLPRDRALDVGLEVVASAQAPQLLGDLEDGRLDAGPDVERAVDVRAPGREQRRDRVVDEEEVARLGPVAVDRRPPAVDQPVAEDRHDARLAERALARAVDVREPQRDGAQPVEVAVQRHVALGAELALAVRGVGPHRRVLGQREGVQADRPRREPCRRLNGSP